MSLAHDDTERRNKDIQLWQERIVRVETKQEIDIDALTEHKTSTKQEFTKVYEQLQASNRKSDEIIKIVTDIQVVMSNAKGKYTLVTGILSTCGGVCLMFVGHKMGWL